MLRKNGLLISACVVLILSFLAQRTGQTGIYAKSWVDLGRVLQYMAVWLGVLWVSVTGIYPVFFAKKCPYCSHNFWHPSVLEKSESTVYGGGFDSEGAGLPPIIKRTYSCPKCDYQRWFHKVPEVIWGLPYIPKRVAVSLNPTEMEKVDRIYDKAREDIVKNTPYKTYDDWKAYLLRLQGTDGERPGKQDIR